MNKMLPEFVKSFSDFMEIARYLSPVPWDADVVRAYARRKLAVDLEKGNDFTLAMIQTLRGLLGDDIEEELTAWVESRAAAIRQPIEQQLHDTRLQLDGLIKARSKSRALRISQASLAFVVGTTVAALGSYFTDFIAPSVLQRMLQGAMIVVVIVTAAPLLNEFFRSVRGEQPEVALWRAEERFILERLHKLEALKEADLGTLLKRRDRKIEFSEIEPVGIAEEGVEVAADIQVFIDSADYAGVVSRIESISDKTKRASYYKALANIFMSRQDKLHSISATHKYKEIEGETPDGYWALGYVYWWFGDTETAIIHTEHVLKLASDLSNSSAKHKMLGKAYNALAYYYAEKGIKQKMAFSYVAKCFEQPFLDPDRMSADLDTRGFVSLKFGSTEDRIDSAINDFNQALEIEPDNSLILKHLSEAYTKRKELKNKRA